MDETFKWRALKNNQFASRSNNRKLSKHKLEQSCNIPNNKNVDDTYTSTSVILEDNVIEIHIAKDISNVEIQEALAISSVNSVKSDNIHESSKSTSNGNKNNISTEFASKITLYEKEKRILDAPDENKIDNVKQMNKDLSKKKSTSTIFICTSLGSNQETMNYPEKLQQQKISQNRRKVNQSVNNNNNQDKNSNTSEKCHPVRRSKRLNNQSDRQFEYKSMKEEQQIDAKDLKESLESVGSLQLLGSKSVDFPDSNHPSDNDHKMRNTRVKQSGNKRCDMYKDERMKKSRFRCAQNTNTKTKTVRKSVFNGIIDNNISHINNKYEKKRNHCESRLLFTKNTLNTSAFKSAPKNIICSTKQCGKSPKLCYKSRERSRKTRSLKKIYVKSSQRSSKDGSDGILASAIARKEQNDTVGFQGRLLRPIKLSAKILANDDLRYDFEQRNNIRLKVLSDTTDTPTKSSLTAKQCILRTDNLEKPLHKPQMDTCVEPGDYLSKIYNNTGDYLSTDNGNNNSSENNDELCQSQQLIELKEKHFLKLGLMKIDRILLGVAEGNESNISESRMTSGQDIVISDANSLSSATVIHILKEPDMLSVFRLQRKFICHCQQRTKFFIAKTQNNGLCTAIDDIDGYSIGCSRKLYGELQNLVRPGCRISYQLLCHMHHRRLKHHNCCPICGLFCTQGDFVLCSRRHLFHRSCSERKSLTGEEKSNIINTSYLKCPHCGMHKLNKCSNVQLRCYPAPSCS